MKKHITFATMIGIMAVAVAGGGIGAIPGAVGGAVGTSATDAVLQILNHYFPA